MFAIVQALAQGWSLINEGTILILKKGDIELRFDKVLQTPRGCIRGIAIETAGMVEVEELVYLGMPLVLLLK